MNTRFLDEWAVFGWWRGKLKGEGMAGMEWNEILEWNAMGTEWMQDLLMGGFGIDIDIDIDIDNVVPNELDDLGYLPI